MARSSCTFTLWDSQWDPFLRRVIFKFSESDRELISRVLYDARCTSLKKAKALSRDSPALSALSLHLRDELLAAVDAAEIQGETNHQECVCSSMRLPTNSSPLLVLSCLYNLATDTRPMLPQKAPTYWYTDECPPIFERQLHLILQDKAIRDADPQSLLSEALITSAVNGLYGVHRLQAAKALTADSLCLQDVPAAARTRFLELLDATPSEAGT